MTLNWSNFVERDIRIQQEARQQTISEVLEILKKIQQDSGNETCCILTIMDIEKQIKELKGK